MKWSKIGVMSIMLKPGRVSNENLNYTKSLWRGREKETLVKI